MRWYHETDPSWLLARRDVITATELKSCLSAYNKATNEQKAGDILLPAFASIWAKKQASSGIDTFSSGPAARGHIVEPYAILDFNQNNPDVQDMYHWDDVILKRRDIGWSPDGMNVPQDTICHEMHVKDDCMIDSNNFEHPLPTEFIEVKSYEPDQHIKRILTMPSKLDERWQMACAFETVPSLQKGYLLFYSVNTDLSFCCTYSRDDLKDEILQVEKMVDLWRRNKSNLEKMPVRFERRFDEEAIYEQWQREQSCVLGL